jgi:CRISPR-associated endonuclease/helicase Cas3
MIPKLKPDKLLAKSYQPGHWKGSYSLVGHTSDVVDAVTTLVDTLGDRLIEQFGLTCNLSYLRATARLAAYLHDWGKANHHFQGVVRANLKDADPKRFLPNQPQMLRHEVVSILLAWEFKDWLEQAEGDFYTAIAAAGGHHLKLGGRAGKCTDELGEIRQSGDVELYLYTLEKINNKLSYNRHFRGLLKYGIKHIGLPKNIRLSKTPLIVWSQSIIKKKQVEIQEKLSFEWDVDQVSVGVIKALLIAGDAVGSALPSVDQPISHKEWIVREITRTLDELKLQKVIDSRLDGKELRPFQINLGNTPSRVTIARAGCGTGKTLGAYNWAKSWALDRKLFFCYPTTGTSTEGFIDYVHGQVDAVLLHSRADVDLEMMATGEEDDTGDESNNEAAIKLDSFKAWGRESIVCTVDTVLGMFQCNRRPLYCFPAIANAAFVFDEVHCYDPQLFAALLRFLQVVKAPILLMSASVLPWQKEAIEKAVGEPVEIIEGAKDLEALPRYRFTINDSPGWERVEQELKSGGKVLWVCNQVNTAITIYEEAKERGLEALLYHSRFRYGDRVKHHRDVVDAFKPEQKKPVIAICTQVAEMSLDLSATLLVSQIADPAGLIQRLGRLNRRYCGHALDALFYPDEKVGFPYSAKTLTDGLDMIKNFSGEINQSQLADWLEQSVQPLKTDESIDMIWLDGIWKTYPISLREAGHNVTVLLQKDLLKIKGMAAKEIPRYTVPIPAKNIQKWEKHKFYPIAPTNIWGYSEELGAFDLTKRE